MTAGNRWLGHVGGTAGEDGAGLRRGSDDYPLDRRPRPVLGDHVDQARLIVGSVRSVAIALHAVKL
jgi:hypothetical protein